MPDQGGKQGHDETAAQDGFLGAGRSILRGYDEAGVERGKRDLPEIPRRTDEFDAGSELVVVGFLDVDDAAILMLVSAAIHDAERLSDGNGHADNHQAPVGAHALHLRGFAKELSFAFKSDYFNGDDQPEALASALHARCARRSLGIHTSRG